MTVKRNIYILFTIIFLQGFVFYGPIATLYRQSHGLNLGQIFLIEAICLAIMISLEIPWGYVADRIGYKKTLIIANGIFFISKILFWKATGFSGFLIERIFLAISISGISGCDQALLYNSSAPENSDKIFSHYTMLSSLGFLLASGLSTIILKHSMELTTFLTIFPYGLSFVLSLFLVDIKKPDQAKTSIKKHIRSAFSNRSIIYLVIAAAFMIEINQAITVFLNQGLYIKSNIPIYWFGPILIIVQLFRLASGKTYKLTRTFGEFNIMIILSVVTTIICLILSISSNMIISIMGVVLIATSCSMLMPIVSNIENKSIDSSDRATILSIYSMLMSSIGIFSNIIIGQMAKIEPSYGFLVCSIMGCAMFIALIKFKSTSKKQN